MAHAVESLGPPPPNSAPAALRGLPTHMQLYSKWCSRALALSRNISVDPDDVNRHLCCELYSSGWDKLAEEVTRVLLNVHVHGTFMAELCLQVLRAVRNQEELGSQLLVVVGRRLNRFVFDGNAAQTVDKISKCSTTLSTWLKTLVSR